MSQASDGSIPLLKVHYNGDFYRVVVDPAVYQVGSHNVRRLAMTIVKVVVDLASGENVTATFEIGSTQPEKDS